MYNMYMYNICIIGMIYLIICIIYVIYVYNDMYNFNNIMCYKILENYIKCFFFSSEQPTNRKNDRGRGKLKPTIQE